MYAQLDRAAAGKKNGSVPPDDQPPSDPARVIADVQVEVASDAETPAERSSTESTPSDCSSPFFVRAGEGIRTLDIQLGKLTLCQLSYARNHLIQRSLRHFSDYDKTRFVSVAERNR